MTREINAPALAAEWLRGEDAWQWQRGTHGKFPIEEDVQDLYRQAVYPWQDVFRNYLGRFQIFHEGGAFTQAAQALGKLAATARALQVTVEVAKAGEPYEARFQGVNTASLQTLGALAARPLSQEIDWANLEITTEGLHESVNDLGLPLQGPEAITDELTENVERLYHNEFDLLASYFQLLRTRGHELPESGHTSGEIVAWHVGL